MTKLVAALLQLPIFSQDAMHSADRAEIDALVQQRGIDLRRSLVAEALRVQMIEHDLAFSRTESPLRCGTDPGWSGWLHMAIQRGPRHAEGATGDCLTKYKGHPQARNSSSKRSLVHVYLTDR